MKITIYIQVLFYVALVHYFSYSQSVAINEDGSSPDPSSILDVKSTTKGILVPRLTTNQRNLINPAANGLLVFDTNTESFWFRQSSGWLELIGQSTILTDNDSDTKIQVEEVADEDQIRLDIGGYEAMVLRENTEGAAVLDFGTDLGLIIGHQAGENSVSGFNTFIGYKAAENNTFGQRNVIVGYLAGQKNVDADRSVIIGYEAGLNNDATGSTIIGYQSGRLNTTGHSNVFLGYESGTKNVDGYRNTFLGYGSGKNTSSGFQNTFLGFNSGFFNTTGMNNVFLGNNAGYANRTGSRNTYVGFGAGSNPLSGVDFGDGNTVVGFEAGYRSNEAADNVIIGDQSGYEITSGKKNILIGKESGFLMNDDSLNVAIGFRSQRENNLGHSNISIGDSSLLKTDGNNNIAFGANAGDENISGNNNIFIGQNSGRGNWGEDDNIYIGHNTSLNTATNASGSIAIGHDVELGASNSIIIGNPLNQNLNMGIGLNNPTAKVHIHSDLPGNLALMKIASYAGRSLTVFPNQGITVGSISIAPDQGILVQGKSILKDTVVINRDDPAKGYMLSVNGDIACEEVRIQNSIAWPDYVFEEDYPLTSLEDLEKIIKSQRHLPGIPSAKEVDKNGILMNKITADLLQKIEELHLYVFELNKEIDLLKSIIDNKND